jgi:adenosylcobinamide kinase / adenosylcobinamide-phosphate guanylyltransferase
MPGKLIFLLGGARSGKSSTAERMARVLGGDSVLYVATAEAFDDEMRAAIAKHQADRPSSWQTLEAPLRIGGALVNRALPAVVLIDCITLLASNALLSLPEECTQEQANAAVMQEVTPLLDIQRDSESVWLLVSNEVGMGIVPPYRLGRLYRNALGRANQAIATAADEVYLLVAGIPWKLK